MRTDRKSRRYRDAMGNFVFIRKPKPADETIRIHIRSYRADKKMLEGFAMCMPENIKVGC